MRGYVECIQDISSFRLFNSFYFICASWLLIGNQLVNIMNMNPRNLLITACTSGLFLSQFADAASETNLSDVAKSAEDIAASQVHKKPNLLYIFPDQYRLHALSIWRDPAYRNVLSTVGDPVHTPNLDKLAKRGVLFTQTCSSFPVSSPHRGMLMSGMYPRENGVENNCHIGRKFGLKEDIVCFTDVLANAGYETAYIGKTHWHKTEALFDKDKNYVGTTEAPGGHSMNPYDTYIPEGKSRHGNKYWFQDIKGHYTSYTYSNRPELVDGKKDGQVKVHEGFTATHEADIVIKYLQNKNGERIADKPFSIIWSINPPHPPYNSLEDCDVNVYNELYKDMPVDQLLPRENAKVQWMTDQGKKKNITMNARIYFSLIKSVDEEIGRVLKALEETGESDNTVVVFTSDHGEMMGSHEMTGKNKIYDESFLVPYIISYPSVLKPHVEDLMMGSVDIMPTILGLMGLDKQIPSTVMGHDYSDGIMTGTYKKNPKPTSAVYVSDKSKGVRTYKYTYMVNPNGTYELYNNQEDPYQMKRLKLQDIPETDCTELKKALGEWLKVAHDKWYDKKKNAELIHYDVRAHKNK